MDLLGGGQPEAPRQEAKRRAVGSREDSDLKKITTVLAKLMLVERIEGEVPSEHSAYRVIRPGVGRVLEGRTRGDEAVDRQGQEREQGRQGQAGPSTRPLLQCHAQLVSSQAD